MDDDQAPTMSQWLRALRSGALLVGGAILGCATAPANPRAEPVMLSPGEGGALLDVYVGHRPYAPRLPPRLQTPGTVVWGTFQVCVSTDGEVTGVRIVQSADKLVDEDWVETLRTWRYRPYLQNGVRLPFCYLARVEVRVSG
jgi:hypothetical protein